MVGESSTLPPDAPGEHMQGWKACWELFHALDSDIQVRKPASPAPEPQFRRLHVRRFRLRAQKTSEIIAQRRAGQVRRLDVDALESGRKFEAVAALIRDHDKPLVRIADDDDDDEEFSLLVRRPPARHGYLPPCAPSVVVPGRRRPPRARARRAPRAAHAPPRRPPARTRRPPLTAAPNCAQDLGELEHDQNKSGARTLRSKDLELVRAELRAAAHSSNLRALEFSGSGGQHALGMHDLIVGIGGGVPTGLKGPNGNGKSSTCQAAIETLLWFGLALGDAKDGTKPSEAQQQACRPPARLAAADAAQTPRAPPRATGRHPPPPATRSPRHPATASGARAARGGRDAGPQRVGLGGGGVPGRLRRHERRRRRRRCCRRRRRRRRGGGVRAADVEPADGGAARRAGVAEGGGGPPGRALRTLRRRASTRRRPPSTPPPPPPPPRSPRAARRRRRATWRSPSRVEHGSVAHSVDSVLSVVTEDAHSPTRPGVAAAYRSDSQSREVSPGAPSPAEGEGRALGRGGRVRKPVRQWESSAPLLKWEKEAMGQKVREKRPRAEPRAAPAGGAPYLYEATYQSDGDYYGDYYGSSGNPLGLGGVDMSALSELEPLGSSADDAAKRRRTWMTGF